MSAPDGRREAPLAGLRVLDTTDAWGASCGRFLADLGADVVLVEPPGGLAGRHRRDGGVGAGVAFAVNAANKRSVVVDRATSSGRDRFLSLLGSADIWVDGAPPGDDGTHATIDAALATHPSLVVVSISPFGLTGPYRDRPGAPAVIFGLSTLLSQSGVPGRPPVAPPAALAEQVTGVQAAWAALLAHWRRLRTGLGDHLDVSVFEAVTQTLDPPVGAFGAIGMSRGGVPLPRGRALGLGYPTLRARDGHVRIALLAPRQWRAMRAWLGEPSEFADPSFDDLYVRHRHAEALNARLAALCADRTTAELLAEGGARGVPVAPVLDPAAVLAHEHYRVRQTFVFTTVDGSPGRLPNGYVRIDDAWAGTAAAAPEPGQHDGVIDWSPPPLSPRLPETREATDRGAAGDRNGRADPSGPLVGLRVLDLGVIVMGAEAGRLLADQGADVIKVETRAFPDAARAAGINHRTAAGQRNKRSLGINLRDPDGRALFERLVEQADVVLTNFKPGTLASLGIEPDRLRSINPRLVVTLSSAMGESGPLRDWMGYGPLVRCAAGLTAVWRDPEHPDEFADGATIFPDHFAARVVAAAVLALLVRRRRSGIGAVVEAAQAEIVLNAIAPEILQASLGPGAPPVPDRPAILGCAGDDEWCIADLAGDDAGERLAALVGRDDPTAQAVWASVRTPAAAAIELQAAGVPAAPMVRPPEMPDDPHLQARGFFHVLRQPQLAEPVITEGGPALARHLPAPPLAPAPEHGQHTREICRELLGLDGAAIDDLVRRAVLEEPAPPAPPVASAPANTSPTRTPPAGTRPAGTSPAGSSPAGTSPAGTSPAGTSPAGTSP